MGKNDNMSASLTSDIKSFLLEVRYWKEDHAKNALRKQVTYWSEFMNKWEEADCALDSFNAFVRQHSGQLVGNAPLTAEQCELRPKRSFVKLWILKVQRPARCLGHFPSHQAGATRPKFFHYLSDDEVAGKSLRKLWIGPMPKLQPEVVV